ncbi:MAG: hypothetical protein WCT46_01570 [Candidatus Gracilibacteria bacterium]|jgi:hypothetical protein
MLSKAPKYAAILFALSVLAPSPEVNAARNLIRGEVANAISQDDEYIREGSQRIVRVRGENLDNIHSIASRQFVSKVEEEIKSPGANLSISGFETSVRFEDGRFVFEYKVQLNPAKNPDEVHTMISMRGTVWSGSGARDRVLHENSNKIPQWQQRMITFYPDMKISYELAQSDNSAPNGFRIFHEAVLAKGVRIQ